MTDLIYCPSGKAAEYSPALACNPFRGCQHGCKYCYVPNVLHTDRDGFHAESCLRSPDFLERLEREAERKSRLFTGRVFLAFTTDAYQEWDRESAYTRQIIQILHRHGFCVNVLTKGGELALRDLDLFTPQDCFGITLTGASRDWEPGAAPEAERIATLHYFQRMQVPTWVSCEPVIDPDTVLSYIHSLRCVDVWKVGRLNYHPHAATIIWGAFAHQAVSALQSVGARYRLKDDLACYVAPENREYRPEI